MSGDKILRMHYVYSPLFQLDPNDSQQIVSAVLRNDGSVYVKVNENLVRVSGVPNTVKKIAISKDGLWAINKRGELFAWNRDFDDSEWTTVESYRLRDIFGLENGRLCGVTRSGETVVFHKDIENETAEVVWEPAPEIANWIGPQSSSRSSLLSLNLRSILLFILALSLILGPWAIIQRGHEREEAIKLLKLQGAEIQYAHQFDAKGNFTEDALEPGPSWLKSLVGRQIFVTPVRLDANNAPLDLSLVARLKHLTHVDLGSWDDLVDITPLESLRQLEEFRVTKAAIDNISVLSRMRRLKKLDLSGTHVSDISTLEKLTNLQVLDLAETKVVNLTPLEKLTQLKSLDLTDCNIQSLQPITNLISLQSLYYDTLQRKHLHPFQLHKLTKLKSLRIGNLDSFKSDDWSSQMKTLNKRSRLAWRYHIKTKDQATYLQLKSSSAMPTPGDPLDSLNLNNSLFDSLDQTVDLSKCEHISFDNTIIDDLSPLKKHAKNLKTISLNGSNVVDLKELASAETLSRLKIENTNISDISPLVGCKKLWIFNASHTKIQNIEALSNLSRLDYITLAGTDVSDISPLSNLRGLTSLTLSDTKVEDIAALSKFNGHKLDLTGSPVDSLAPLRTAKFTRSGILMVSGTQISDLSPIGLQKELTELHAAETLVSDAKGIEQCKSLRTLDLSGTRITEFSPIAKLKNLSRLLLRETQIADLSGIEKLKRLKTIDFSGCPIVSIPDLTELESLKEIDLSNTPLNDLASLGKLKNRFPGLRKPSINLARIHATDFSPLKNIKAASKLDLSGTKIIDLGDLPLAEELSISHTKVTSLLGLQTSLSFRGRQVVLEKLDLSQSKVTDISPLANANALVMLNLAGTKVEDFSPLANLDNLIDLDLSETGLTDATVLHTSAIKLETLNLSNTPFADLKQLAAMTQLSSLKLSGTQIVDLQPIEEFLPWGLDSLDLTNCKLTDIEPLKQLQGLLQLKLNCEGLTDLSPLSSMTILKILSLENVSPTLDLTPISNLEYVRSLRITGIVNDISKLRTMTRLTELRLPAGTKVPGELIDSFPRLEKLFVGEEEVFSRR